MNSLTSAVLSEAAAQATALPVYRLNRLRAAAAVDIAYEGMEVYETWKPTIFAASVAGMLISGSILARRVRTPEAWALYGILCTISGLSAWITRPQWMFPAPPPTQAADPNAPSAMNGLLGRLDARAARNNVERPGWEGATLSRLATDLGTGTMNPAVAALLTRNTH